MNSTLNLDPELAARFVLTLAHFVWQGAAIGLGALVVGAVLKRASARLRYGVYLAALAAMALCPPVTYMVLGADGNYESYGKYGTDASGVMGPASRSTVADQIAPAGAASPASRPSAIDPPTASTASTSSTSSTPSTPSTPSTASTSSTSSTPSTSSTSSTPSTSSTLSTSSTSFTSSTPSDSHSLAQASAPTSALAPGVAAAAQAAVTWRTYTPHLVLAYIAGVLLMLARLALGLAGGGRLRKRADRITDSAIIEALQRHAAQLKLRAVPVIAYCQRVAVPTVVGIVRPMILLPASLATGMPPQQVELLLLHELAHIRRYDHLVNIAQRLIEAALFFHPAVWYVSHRIRVEREHCCDDLVIALGGERHAYAESLVAAAALATGARLSPAALAATGKPSQLRRRIHRLLGDPQPPVRLVRGGWVLAVLAIAAVIAGASQVANINSAEPEREVLAQAESTTKPPTVEPVAPPTVKPEPKPVPPKPVAAPVAEKPAKTTDPNSVKPAPESAAPAPAPETKELQDKYNELSTQMADPDWWLRKVAVQQLGELPYHPHFVFSLIQALKDEDPRVQAAAAEGLAKQGDPDAIKHLVAALKNDSQVREAASEALTRFTPEQVMPLLTLAAQDEDAQVCGGAVTALGKQNTPEAAAVLVSLLPKYYGEQGGPVAPVVTARRGVSRGRSSISLGPVGRLLASAFGDMAPERAMDSLDRASKEGDWKTRTQVALVLDASGLRSTPAAQSLLTAFLADGQKDVRAAAAQVLGNAFSESVEKGTTLPSEMVAPLTPLLRDPNRAVAFLAASALQKARWQPGSPEERAWYLVALQQSREAASLGPVAFEPLVHALQADSTPAFTSIGNTAEAPSDAIEGLFQLEDPRKVDPLIAALKDADAQLARSIAFVLGEAKAPQAVDALIQMLGHVEAYVRATAAEALGKIKDPRAVDPLVALLSETEPSIREYAVIALGEIGDVRAAPALRPFLTEDKGVSTATVAKALGGIRDPESAPLLADIALDPERKDREACCEALQKIGGPAAQETFLRLLGHDTDEKVRSTAASLLGTIGDPATVPALRDAFFFDSSIEVKDTTITALGKIDGLAAVNALSVGYDYALANLHDGKTEAWPFVKALMNNTDPSALDAMVRLADRDGNPTLRFRVAQVLAERGDPRAVPMLQDLRNQPETRIDATNTLEKLEQQSPQPDQPSAGEQPSATEQPSEAVPENPSDPSDPSDSPPQTSQLAGPRLQFRWVLEGPTLAAPTASEPDRTLAVADDMVLTEGDIASAEVQKDPSSEYFQVLFQTTEDGARKLKTATEGNLSRKLAIVFDGRVLSAPVVRAPIGSAGAITGNLSEAEAQAIADVITSKKSIESLPQRMLYDSERIELNAGKPMKIVDPEAVEPKKPETEGAQQ